MAQLDVNKFIKILPKVIQDKVKAPITDWNKIKSSPPPPSGTIQKSPTSKPISPSGSSGGGSTGIKSATSQSVEKLDMTFINREITNVKPGHQFIVQWERAGGELIIIGVHADRLSSIKNEILSQGGNVIKIYDPNKKTSDNVYFQQPSKKHWEQYESWKSTQPITLTQNTNISPTKLSPEQMMVGGLKSFLEDKNKYEEFKAQMILQNIGKPKVQDLSYTTDFGYYPSSKPYDKLQQDLQNSLLIIDKNIEAAKEAKMNLSEYKKYVDDIGKTITNIEKMSDDPAMRIYVDVDGMNRPYTKQQSINMYKKYYSDAQKAYESNKKLASNYLSFVKGKRDVLTNINLIEEYRASGYKLSYKEGSEPKFSAPKPTDVVEWYYGDRPDLYTAQSLRTVGIGSLASGIQQLFTGSGWEEHVQSTAEGILGSSKRKGESALDYTGRFWTSPEVIMDVYLPLITLGASKAITIGGRALVGTRIGTSVGAKIGTIGTKVGSTTIGRIGSTAMKAFGSKAVQATLLGGTYVAIEGPQLAGIAIERPGEFGTYFGQSAYRFGVSTGAGYYGIASGLESNMPQRLLSGWQTTKEYLQTKTPTFFGIGKEISSKINAFKLANKARPMFSSAHKSFILASRKGVMISSGKEIISTTPDIQIIGTVSPEDIGVISAKSKQIVSVGEKAYDKLKVYEFKGGFEGVNVEGKYPRVGYKGYLLTSTSEEPVVARMINPFTVTDYIDVTVSNKAGFTFGRATTEVIISGEPVKLTMKPSLLGIGKTSKQITRPTLSKLGEIKTKTTVSDFFGTAKEAKKLPVSLRREGGVLRKYLLPEKTGMDIKYVFSDLRIVDKSASKIIPVKGVTRASTGYEGLVTIKGQSSSGKEIVIKMKGGKLKTKLPGETANIVKPADVTKFEYLGQLGKVTPEEHIRDVILVEKGAIRAEKGIFGVNKIDFTDDIAKQTKHISGKSPVGKGQIKITTTHQLSPDVEVRLTQQMSGLTSGLVSSAKETGVNVISKIVAPVTKATTKAIVSLAGGTAGAIASKYASKAIRKDWIGVYDVPVSSQISKRKLIGSSSMLSQREMIRPTTVKNTLIYDTRLVSPQKVDTMPILQTVGKSVSDETDLIGEIKTDELSGTKIIQDELIGTDFENILGMKMGLSFRDMLENKLRQGTSVDTEQISKTKQDVAKLLGYKQRLATDMSLEKITIAVPVVPPTVVPPRPVVRPPPPLPKGEDETKRKKIIKTTKKSGYDVYVKERSMYRGKIIKGTKFKKINAKPLDEKTALALGGQITDETAAISFKIKKSDGNPVKIKTSKNWANLAHKFKKKGDVYIEQNPYRIDTIGEVKEITRRGKKSQIIESKLKKGGKNVRYF